MKSARRRVPRGAVSSSHSSVSPRRPRIIPSGRDARRRRRHQPWRRGGLDSDGRKRRRGACRLGPTLRLASRAYGVVHQPQPVKNGACTRDVVALTREAGHNSDAVTAAAPPRPARRC